jgi:hypothetical protein
MIERRKALFIKTPYFRLNSLIRPKPTYLQYLTTPKPMKENRIASIARVSIELPGLSLVRCDCKK